MKFQNPDGSINLEEWSKFNGKSEFENFQAVIAILSIKAKVTPQTVIMTCKELDRAQQRPAIR